MHPRPSDEGRNKGRSGTSLGSRFVSQKAIVAYPSEHRGAKADFPQREMATRMERIGARGYQKWESWAAQEIGDKKDNLAMK